MYKRQPARVAASDKIVRHFETALSANRRLNVRERSQMLSISVGNVHSILHSLGYHKVAAQWIPRLLTDEQKNLCLALSLQHLMCYQQQSNAFLHQIVASDES